MERALRVARPAGRMAARHPTVSPSSLGLLWQRCGIQTASRPAHGVANQLTLDRPRKSVRYNHTAAETGNETVSQSFGEETQQHRSTKQSVETKGGLVEWNTVMLTLFRRAAGHSPVPPLTLSLLWLRDTCPCVHCVDPDSGQKSFSTTDLPDYPVVEHAELMDSGELKVIWANDALSGGGVHSSLFRAEVVRRWQEQDTQAPYKFASQDPKMILWGRAEYEALLADGRCRVSYQDWIHNDEAFRAAFSDLRKTGLIFVTDVPQEKEQVRRVASRFGSPQYTIYGWTWDVKSKPRAENVAYTSQFLGLHQDLMYNHPIPELQLLHCHSNDCEGGESLFSHGVRAAYELKHAHPEHYYALTHIKSFFGYHKRGNNFSRAHPTVITDRNNNIRETRWSPPFQEPFPLTSDDQGDEDLRRWKVAAAQFKAIAESPSNTVEIKLKPGDCVIFNNRQILHGRRQFSQSQTGEGSRWLEGTYIGPDVYRRAVRKLTKQTPAGKVPRHSSSLHDPGNSQ
ncbi:hypothetical protein C8A03DRAFT_38649 [Achaetomium macrosporum]|uniref:Gamma-butyrobetaine dioxygenase n=1 Tax=Achaetomium macrosporum TaxID=79813 RepID=A0AAN7H717_9PEZI|nr:hypothetical protein C8A03DRAFT_38649 [Achaetomium macrosporum]